MPKWRQVLNDYGLTYYHATEFNGGYGECSKLSKGDRIDCVRRLILAASSVNLEYVAYVIERSLFESVVRRYSWVDDVSDYDYLVLRVLSDLQIRGKVERDLNIYVSIEPGCSLKGDLLRLVEISAHRGWQMPIRQIWRGNNDMAQYQVADMIAYETHKYFMANPLNSELALRKSFELILEGNPLRPYLISREWLERDLPTIIKTIEMHRGGELDL